MDKSIPHVTKPYAEQRAGGGSGDSPKGLVCPRCGAITMVTHTRRLFGMVRRYRQCIRPRCRVRFVTEEKM